MCVCVCGVCCAAERVDVCVSVCARGECDWVCECVCERESVCECVCVLLMF